MPCLELILELGTVCFFPFGILYDDIASKVLKIIEFCKKFLKEMGNAFYDVKLIGLFYKRLILEYLQN